MSPESGRAHALLLRLLLPALWLQPAGVAIAAAPKAGEKRICVPSADGKAWECGTPESPPPERGLPARIDSGAGAPPPTFLAAPPSEPVHAYSAQAPAPVPAPARPLPDQFPSVQRGDPATPAPQPVVEASVPAPEPEAPPPVTVETPVAATVEPRTDDLAPPPFLAAPPVRRPVPLAPVLVPADAAREEALATAPVDPGPNAPATATHLPADPAPPVAGAEEPLADTPAVAESASEAGLEPAPLATPAMPDAGPLPPVDDEAIAASAAMSEQAAVDEPAAKTGAKSEPPAVEEPAAVAAAIVEPVAVEEPNAEAAAISRPPAVEEPVADAAAISEPEPPGAVPVEAPAPIEPVAATAADSAPLAVAPTSDPAATGESAAVVAPELAPAPVVAPPTAAGPLPTPAAIAVPLQAPAEFLRLPASAWTAQLGRSAGRIDGALAAIGSDRRAIAPPIYLVAVGAADSRQWLLLWSRFDDADATRQALRAAGLSGVPRRIGPLQSEVRAAGTLMPPAHASVHAASPIPAAGGASDWQPAPPSRNDVAALALPAAATFEALPANAWTVQLARAGSSTGFPALLARAGLVPADCHVLALAEGGARTYLLLWSQFPDAAAARAAARSLRGVPGAFVRRVGPLQAEARRAR